MTSVTTFPATCKLLKSHRRPADPSTASATHIYTSSDARQSPKPDAGLANDDLFDTLSTAIGRIDRRAP